MLLPCFLIAAMLPQPSSTDAPMHIQSLLGIPYVPDAVEDAQRRFVLFANPEQVLPQAGLNCSGFVVAASRRLLGFKGSPSEAGRDRRGDSGPGAPLGKDWDFGLDLILNLTEGHARRIVLPEGKRTVPDADGRTMRGFEIGKLNAWAPILPQLRADFVYLASLSRVKRGQLAHHHVAIVLKDAANRTWFYHTLPRGKVHRVSLDSAEGRARMLSMFGPHQRLLLVEAEPTPWLFGAQRGMKAPETLRRIERSRGEGCGPKH